MQKTNDAWILPGKRPDDLPGIPRSQPMWWRSIAQAGACIRCQMLHNQIRRYPQPPENRHHPNCRCILLPVGVGNMTQAEREALHILQPEEQDRSILTDSDMAAMLALQLTWLKLMARGEEATAAAIADAMDAIRLKPEYLGLYQWQDEDGRYSPRRFSGAGYSNLSTPVNVETGASKNAEERFGLLIGDLVGMSSNKVAKLTEGLYKMHIRSKGSSITIKDWAALLIDVFGNFSPEVSAGMLNESIHETLTYQGSHTDENHFVDVAVNYLSQVDTHSFELNARKQGLLGVSESSQDAHAGFSYGAGKLENHLPLMTLDGADGSYYVYHLPKRHYLGSGGE